MRMVEGLARDVGREPPREVGEPLPDAHPERLKHTAKRRPAPGPTLPHFLETRKRESERALRGLEAVLAQPFISPEPKADRAVGVAVDDLRSP